MCQTSRETSKGDFKMNDDLKAILGFILVPIITIIALCISLGFFHIGLKATKVTNDYMLEKLK